ncbi:MFS transporter [Chitinophaga filiformis]|uniref:Predicted arabinose efflux permease, MFS family n=1 Tax=Chitinophaga filiformis TaxID=104663 RepID=A0A1G7XN30_CHIFI|nr:MFS transporter [Chitinophaga filiformis]SDG85648.1 Predicted arabinose efflux permease, MFS family [Chitinophaga filiformis]
MRRIKESRIGWNTIMSLGLIPLSGFAMDVYIPSLPDMAVQLHTSPAAIQLTLSLFIISYGISQLIVGGLIDSYGRYIPNLAAILVFSISSFIIAYSTNMQVIYAMRIVQGFTVAVIAISKRAFFIDLYQGEALKKYTSMFSVIWAIAPIVAPFLGGFFETTWGWSSNFMFLGYFGLVFFVIEAAIGGESMKAAQPFSVRSMAQTYGHMIRTPDFTSGIVVLGLAYGMVLLYGMCSPFLIEHQLHLAATVTGYCSLFSGLSVFMGGTISRMLVNKPFGKKLVMASIAQLIAVAVMIPLTIYYHNIFTLLLYVFLLHSTGGFIFNNLMSYCLIRFPQYAGKASGLTGGGFAVVTSILSTFMVKSISITNQAVLGVAYGIIAALMFLILAKTKWKGSEERKEKEVTETASEGQQPVFALSDGKAH